MIERYFKKTKNTISISTNNRNTILGNVFDAQDRDRLTQNGITHIINCTPDLPCYWDKGYEYKRIAALDSPSQNIRRYFDEVVDFIG